MDFTNLKVLVIGDICLDVSINGSSSRLSPEAPVPVIKNPIDTACLGMAGNVALNLANLGAEVYIEAITADDISGNEILSLLDENNIKTIFYDIPVKHSKINTITKTRILSNGQQVARIDYEDIMLDENSGVIIAKNLEDAYEENYFDLIVISDYDKGLISLDTWEHIRPVLNKLNKNNLFFTDTKKGNVIDFYEGMLIFPNTLELKRILNGYYVDYAEDLVRMLGSDFLVETMSEHGAMTHGQRGEEDFEHYSQAIRTEVFDVCGAGDTFIAAFSLYYTKFKNIKRSLDFANFCCAAVVMKKGTVPITYREAIQFDYHG